MEGMEGNKDIKDGRNIRKEGRISRKGRKDIK